MNTTETITTIRNMCNAWLEEESQRVMKEGVSEAPIGVPTYYVWRSKKGVFVYEIDGKRHKVNLDDKE